MGLLTRASGARSTVTIETETIVVASKAAGTIGCFLLLFCHQEDALFALFLLDRGLG